MSQMLTTQRKLTAQTRVNGYRLPCTFMAEYLLVRTLAQCDDRDSADREDSAIDTRIDFPS